jgi:hypothetical protein
LDLGASPEEQHMTFAHEISHKFDFFESRKFGYAVRSIYEGLVKCLRRSDSIHLQPDQRGETISDWPAARIVARLAKKLPQAERRPYLLKSLSTHCRAAEAESVQYSRAALIEAHPEEILRINGIFGTDPDWREILGCTENNPSPYRHCELGGE